MSTFNIFHCLMELNEHSIYQKMQKYLKSENSSETKLSDLGFMLQISEEVLDVMDINTYRTSKEGQDLG